MDKEERKISQALKIELRKKNTLAFLNEFQRNHRKWMQELADTYKNRGRFGIHLFSLADNYSEIEDIEVALFASLLLSDNDYLLQQQQEMQELLGRHPYQDFFLKRGFAELSRGDCQTKHIAKTFTCYYDIARLFDILYEWRGEYGSVKKAYLATKDECKNTNPFFAMGRILSLAKVNQRQYKVNLLLLHLLTSGGLGYGLWGNNPYGLLCPENRDIIQFLELWFPDYSQCGLTFDRALRAIGLREDIDFYYCYLGFKELQKVNGVEVRQYCHRYINKYNNRNSNRLYELKSMQPRIFFDAE